MSDSTSATSIRWKWVIISIGIFFVAQLLISVIFFVLGILTLGIGFLLFFILKPVAYFVTGIITGYLSPGLTIREPAIGAIVIAVLSLVFELMRQGESRIIGIIVVGVIAYFVAIAGAKIGERLQGNVL